MDVSLSGLRVFRFGVFIFLVTLTLISCGNRYDLSTERGRRARIDDANYHLSKGECGAADEAISPLYASEYVDDEVRIVKASALACYGGYNFYTFVTNLTGSSGFYNAFAKSLTNVAGDAARTHFYNAVDVLTQSGKYLNAQDRGRTLNTFMVFLQFGVIGAIERNYGSPTTSGDQGAPLVYLANGAPDANEMSNVDACALAGAFSHISDAYDNSDLSGGDVGTAVDAFYSACKNFAGLNLSSCASMARDRTVCDGTATTDSNNAAAVVVGVNAGWN